MNILHAVLSAGFYGSERYCIELATAQARAGHHVTVLVQGGPTSCARAFQQEVKITDSSLARGRSSGCIDICAIPRVLPTFLQRPFARRLLARLRPDIVHTHLNTAARRVGTVAQRLGIPHVTTLHIRYEPREHRDCDGLICVAAWQRGTIPPDFLGEITVVWPWLPSAVHAAIGRVRPQEIAALRSRWTADDTHIVFGSIGRLVPEKGMDALALAFRAAFPTGDEPVRLVLLGEGPQAGTLERHANADRRIILMKPESEIAPYYCAFDVYVSAARFEPFGLTIIEAMDAGCMLVVTRTAGPCEYLKDERILWADVDDETMLAARLRAATRLGRMRVDFDLSPFLRERAVAAIDQFYNSVLTRSRTISSPLESGA